MFRFLIEVFLFFTQQDLLLKCFIQRKSNLNVALWILLEMFTFLTLFILSITDRLIFSFHGRDIAVSSDVSCFQGLLFCPEAYYLLLHNFCIYHISPPGHEVCSFISLNLTTILLDWYVVTVMNKHLYCWMFIIYLVAYHLLLSSRAIAVGSSCNWSRLSCSICRWLSGSNSWGA